MIVKLIPHLSDAYWQSVKLRDSILRAPLGLEFTEEELLAEDGQFHFSGYSGDELIAILVLVPQPYKEIKMRQVAIHPSYRGKGIGTELVKKSETWVRRRGFNKMTLHARESATSFYLKMNYKIEGMPFKEVGIPHFKMLKKL